MSTIARPNGARNVTKWVDRHLFAAVGILIAMTSAQAAMSGNSIAAQLLLPALILWIVIGRRNVIAWKRALLRAPDDESRRRVMRTHMWKPYTIALAAVPAVALLQSAMERVLVALGV